MSHSKEVLSVTRYRTSDGLLFENKEDADAYEESLATNDAYKQAEKNLRNMFEKQANALKDYDKEIASLNSEILLNQTILANAQRTINKLNSIEKRGGKLTKDQRDELEKAEIESSAAKKSIVDLTEKLETVNDRRDALLEFTYLPLLEAFDGPAANQVFANNYDALYDLVISNTAKFLSVVSQAAAGVENLENIRYDKESWWGISAEESGPIKQGMSAVIERIA